MADGSEVLSDLMGGGRFQVPRFQRAYAWTKPNFEQFLSDLENHPSDTGRRYFFGTILLTKQSEKAGLVEYDIVDGQQRLTTVVVFAAACIRKLRAQDDVRADRFERIFRLTEDGRARFRTIDEDREFFSRYIDGDEAYNKDAFVTPSQRRLFEAKTYFEKALKEMSADSAVRLLDVLAECQILDYVVESDAEATLIFEMQNDRGKRITDLESIKSFLMHGIYLHAGPHVDEDLKAVQDNFAELYRAAELIEGKSGKPTESQILAHHLVAFEEWMTIEDVDGWSRPKLLVRAVLSKQPPESKRTWIKAFSRRLSDSYKTVLAIIEERDRHRLPALGGLMVLGRVAAYWPLMLKLWTTDGTSDKADFNATLRHLERFAFRASGAGKRADTGDAELRRAARDFKGNYAALNQTLKDMLTWWNIEQTFGDYIDRPDYYHSLTPTYVLWKYENHLRTRTGMQSAAIAWDAVTSPSSPAVAFSVDHIEPKDPNNEKISVPVKWKPEDEERKFSEVALHRLGNLVLDHASGNSRKGNKGFEHRQVPYTSDSTFLSQGEIVSRFASDVVVDGANIKVWDLDAIKRRHLVLVDFARNL